MEDIQTRLQEASKNCLEAYGVWVSSKKDSSARESLMTTIHELRKVASRLEIELAVSERNEMTSKPLPIPPHRASKGAGANQEPEDNFNNSAGEKPRSPRRKRTPPRNTQDG